MSGRVVARAPGKVFLLGEYAVLDGGRAVVAAVDRYVEVRAIRSSLGARIRIDAPGVQATAEFAAANPPVAEGPLRFALAAFHAAVRRMPAIARTGLHIEIASDLALPAGTKTGLGSSAAVCAAVTAALFAAGTTDSSFPIDREQVFATAFEAHQMAQKGVGSGADVAASCYGGLVCVQP
jgi:phosphomevalonate kinase